MFGQVENPGPADPLPRSLYADTGGKAVRTPPLEGEARASVAIIGAGMTGLATAIALGERGVDCTVLEANEPGWGASGRNGGHINPGLKHDPDEIERDFGPDLGQRMVRFSYGAPAAVFDLVGRYGIDCEIEHGGGYRAAIGERHADIVRRLADQLLARDMPVEMHDRSRMSEATGTDRYAAGLYDRRAGQLHPLKYSRGLARAAQSRGATLHCDTPVVAVEKANGGWRLRTPRASLRAEKVLVATNGYTGPLVPGLRNSILPVFSSIVASRPLPEALKSRLLAGRQVVYESGRITIYYRVDAAGRLLIGGRGVMRSAEGPRNFADLIAYAQRLWPELSKIGWEYGWNGRLAITADHYPHVHDLADGRVACIGYNGRGVAVATAIGEQLAARLVDGSATIDLPVLPIEAIAFQRFWRVGAIPVILWNRVADRLGI